MRTPYPTTTLRRTGGTPADTTQTGRLSQTRDRWGLGSDPVGSAPSTNQKSDCDGRGSQIAPWRKHGHTGERPAANRPLTRDARVRPISNVMTTSYAWRQPLSTTLRDSMGPA